MNGKVDLTGNGFYKFARELNQTQTINEVREVYFGTVEEVLPADGIGFYRFVNDATPVLERTSTLSDLFMHAYEEQGRRDDPVLEAVLEHGLPADSHVMLSPLRWHSSAARSILLSEGLAYSMEAPIMESGNVVGTINFARATDGRPFCEEDLSLARLISEHLSLAIERARRLDALGEQATLVQGVLDHFPHGVVVSDLQGRRLFANRNAKRIMGCLDSAPGTSRSSGLEGLVDGVISEFAEDGRQAGTTSVRDGASGQKVIVRSYRGPGKESVISLLYECADEQSSALPVWGVLSPREQEIATLVSQGLTTKHIAQKAFVSENTVKQHLKRIFAKTNVHNRAELVQLIWSSRDRETIPGE
ncbi:DNA-binding CsgD family transcriptional regulator/PAS domain-containing protein [Spinactinospora alkalitolerans]|uniref:DNA-binding CsgD family transcriptional regulator/PAS domain-containing protein n=1 Tax=Spinactinospora alkalitolerans TaxID=687207 RepID=A0A852U2Y9_9ACTN|nr:LuxR C-terminal-related transcriptional regulator [Spinactinospora alkalitolerans]NYE50521.1 DNA-binding CsgD family transcriptional regulator/PAS domain-containing protein [Spinactinospora alkalitolerans]